MPIVKGPDHEIEFGGMCPVQGYGRVDEFPAYFRSRHWGWRLDLFPVGVDVHNWPDSGKDPFWTYGGEHDEEFPEDDEVRRCIAAAVDAWRRKDIPVAKADFSVTGSDVMRVTVTYIDGRESSRAFNRIRHSMRVWQLMQALGYRVTSWRDMKRP